MQFGRKVGLFEKYAFHRAMLQPIHDHLHSRTQCLYTANYEAMVAFKPDILLMAEHHNAFSRAQLPETLVISTTHGFGASKNYIGASMHWFDIVCLPSQWSYDYCVHRNWWPRLDYWVTGFTAMDSSIGADAAPRPPQLSSLPGGPVLLFAPTHTEGLNAMEVLGDQWLRALLEQFPNLNVVVKLHPHTLEQYPVWPQAYRRMTDNSERLLFIEDSSMNIYDLLPHTDILLTDVSSVVMNFLYYDRPIIFVNNPARFQSEGFEPDGLLWEWRDMGAQVDSAAQLPAAIRRALDNPGEHSQRRRLYRERRFGGLEDGGAGARIATRIMDLIEPPAAKADTVRVMRNALRAFARGERQISALRAAIKQQGAYSLNVTFNN